MRTDLTNRRRHEALLVAAQCAEMLLQRYGARRVIPFGSLVGDAPWHEGSDLDLAVEGLSAEALWEAEKQLEGMVPSWLTVDLVPLERAHPTVRARILGEQPRPGHPSLALHTRLADELQGLERVARGLEAALERSGAEPDACAIRALASYIDDVYTGCERLCERVAVTLDGACPRGNVGIRSSWAVWGSRGEVDVRQCVVAPCSWSWMSTDAFVTGCDTSMATSEQPLAC